MGHNMSSLPVKRFAFLASDHVRVTALAGAAAEVVFWLYAFFYVSRHGNPVGDGLEWAAMVPLTIVTLCLAFPALVLSPFRRAAWISAGLVIAAAIADLVIWTQILTELAEKAG
jgi:peptidoglycan biosynthesis protein MviN/MurJ (putative lipid II flippase)